MTEEYKNICTPTDEILSENMITASQNVNKQRKLPKRVLHFSDGVLEEYSSEDETDATKAETKITATDLKALNWGPWIWYQTVQVGSKVLDSCDYMGEYLANFFGITSPKYQFEIDEYYRLQAIENEKRRKEDLEMGGWNDEKQNNLIDNVDKF